MEESDDETIDQYRTRLWSISSPPSPGCGAVDAESGDDGTGSGGLAALHPGQYQGRRQQLDIRDLGERQRYVQAQPAIPGGRHPPRMSSAQPARAPPPGPSTKA